MTRKQDPSFADAPWAATALSTGETLGEASKKGRVLVVLLRHSG